VEYEVPLSIDSKSFIVGQLNVGRDWYDSYPLATKEVFRDKMVNLDPTRKLAIISHMNEDHADACLLYAKHFAAKQQATSAELIDISMSQIILGIEGEELTVDFPRVAQGVDDIRSVLVEMVKLAKGGYEHL
jgi:putative heme iron utilization protein